MHDCTTQPATAEQTIADPHVTLITNKNEFQCENKYKLFKSLLLFGSKTCHDVPLPVTEGQDK